MVSINKQTVVNTKLVRVKERVIKRMYMGREIKLLIFDICETMGDGPVMTHNVYREVWVQDEENSFDPSLDDAEIEAPVQSK